MATKTVTYQPDTKTVQNTLAEEPSLGMQSSSDRRTTNTKSGVYEWIFLIFRLNAHVIVAVPDSSPLFCCCCVALLLPIVVFVSEKTKQNKKTY